MTPLVEVRDLVLQWPGRNTSTLKIDRFRLEGPGVALISGPAGSGKSTLLRVLAGLVPHLFPAKVSGRVRVQGLDPLHQPPRALRRAVALLLQHPETQLAAYLWAREVADNGAPQVPVHRLSRGEVQRLALQQVLATPAPVVLLDEPFANLDGEATAYLVRWLHEHRHRRRILLVSHTLPAGCAPDAAFLLDQGDVQAVSLEHLQALGQVRRAGDAALRPGARRPDRAPTLEATGLRLRRGDRILLQAGDLHLAPGDLALVTGPNGAGKTTLLHWLVGLGPGAGEIRWQGRRVSTLRGAALLVPQQPARVLWGETPEATLRWLGGPRHRLDPPVPPGLFRRPSGHLSGGEAQIAALALGFSLAPPLLLLDEPTHALDAANLDRFRRWLHDYTRQGGMALLSTHHPALFQDLATRIYHLKEAHLAVA